MASYGKYRDTIIKGEKGTDWYVEIHKKDFSGSSTDMTLAGEGFQITWNGSGSTRNRQLLGSECVLNLLVQNDADEAFLYNILDSGFQEYFIRIYKNSTNVSDIWWYGWIQPAFDVVENAPYPYVSTITSTDSFGYYNQRPIDRFVNDASENYTVVMDRNHSIASTCLDFINNMDIYTDSSSDDYPYPGGDDFLRIAMQWTTLSDVSNPIPPMERYFYSKAAYAKNKNFPREYKEYDAFVDILKVFNLVGFLAEGKYHFLQPNKYLNNATALNTFYTYDDIAPVEYSGTDNITTLTTIDQSNNALLGGASFTYDPPLKSARVTYSSIPTFFFIPEGYSVSYGTDFSGGQLLSHDYVLKFDLTHSVDINLSSATGGWESTPYSGLGQPYRIDPTLFSTTIPLEIKITSGATTKWLGTEETGRYRKLAWFDTSRKIILHRGLVNDNQPSTSTFPDWDYTWNVHSSIGDVYAINNTDGPNFMSMSYVQQNTNAGNVEFKTNVVFQELVPNPGFAGTLTINIPTPTVTLNQRGYEDLSGHGAQYYILNMSGGSRSNTKTIINEFTFNRDAVTSSEETENVYESTQSINSAIEGVDLGNITIGQSTDPKTSIRDSSKEPITVPFQVGSDSATSASLNKLLVDRFLEMQVSPLQIMQGSIQSANISPLKIIKYKLNSADSDFDYYMFLGGTFKAQSEIMDGEWFKLKKD